MLSESLYTLSAWPTAKLITRPGGHRWTTIRLVIGWLIVATRRGRRSRSFVPPLLPLRPCVPVRGFAGRSRPQLPHPTRPGTFGAPLQPNQARKDYYT